MFATNSLLSQSLRHGNFKIAAQNKDKDECWIGINIDTLWMNEILESDKFMSYCEFDEEKKTNLYHELTESITSKLSKWTQEQLGPKFTWVLYVTPLSVRNAQWTNSSKLRLSNPTQKKEKQIKTNILSCKDTINDNIKKCTIYSEREELIDKKLYSQAYSMLPMPNDILEHLVCQLISTFENKLYVRIAPYDSDVQLVRDLQDNMIGIIAIAKDDWTPMGLGAKQCIAMGRSNDGTSDMLTIMVIEPTTSVLKKLKLTQKYDDRINMMNIFILMGTTKDCPPLEDITMDEAWEMILKSRKSVNKLVELLIDHTTKSGKQANYWKQFLNVKCKSNQDNTSFYS